MRQIPNLCAIKASTIGVDEFSLGYTINVAKIVQHFISLSDEAHLLCQNISRIIAIVRDNMPQMWPLINKLSGLRSDIKRQVGNRIESMSGSTDGMTAQAFRLCGIK